ncbi:MAG: CRTAC1 family protein [Alphaproteobacteria bacterium]|nr:CRTAC1 family protein [Alphaproteobacteria bacterium]
MRWAVVMLLGACVHGADDDTDVDSDTDAVAATDTPTDPRETDTVDTDTDGLVDTDTVGDTDTDATSDSDTVAETDDTDADSDVEPLRTVPSTWGAGLLDISGAVVSGGMVTVDPGVPPSPGPAREPQGSVALVGDIDENGIDEVVVMTDVNDSGHTLGVQVFRDRGGTLVTAPSSLSSAITGWRRAAVGLVDVDGDGHLDLVGQRWDELVRFGRGDGTWTAPLVPDVDVQIAGVQAGVPALVDLDQDGWLDLLVGTDRCGTSVIPALRSGRRTWTFDPSVVTEGTGRARVVALTTTVLPDGSEGVVVLANPCTTWDPPPGFLRVTHGADGSIALDTVDVTPAQPSWLLDPARAGTTSFTQIEPMGIDPEDLDGDGLPDLWLALSSRWMTVFAARGGTYADLTLRADLELAPPATLFAHFPWGTEAIDLDQDGVRDVITAIGDDETSFRLLGGEPYRDRAWWHGRTWQFEDVSRAIGLDRIASHRGLVLADLDADGDADPVFGGFGSRPTIYRNAIDTGAHGLSLRLHGTTSNHLGIGARVTVAAAGLPDQHLVVGHAANPLGLSEPLVFAGLGTATAGDVTITWPSGVVQALGPLAADALHEVTEPALLTLSDTDRHGRARGDAIRLTVTPRRPDGTVDPGVVVTVDVTGTTLAGAPVWDGAAWQVDVEAPFNPGTSRLTVSLDGVEVPVHPKLWWD